MGSHAREIFKGKFYAEEGSIDFGASYWSLFRPGVGHR
jgi:hypothetical protein